MKVLSRIISLLTVMLSLVLMLSFTGNAVEDTERISISQTFNDAFRAQDSAEGISFFSRRAAYSGCYGNQLTGLGKEVYDSLVKQYAADKKTGAYIFEPETELSVYCKVVNGVAVYEEDSLASFTETVQIGFQSALDAFLYDHPEVFWFRNYSFEQDEVTFLPTAGGKYIITFKSFIITPTEIHQGASANNSEFEKAVASALSDITVSESRRDTLKNIHDYICNNAWYRLVDDNRVHTAEPFFIGDGGVVCEGYAKSFKIICDRLGIPCALVSGDAGGAHMWNCVQMDDGKWYLVDATWDDQDSKIYDTYFLANTNTVGFNGVAISEERTERTDFSASGLFSFICPVISDSAYIPHVHQWDSDYTVDKEADCTEAGSKSIHCSICGSKKNVTEIPAIAHKNSVSHPQQDATCTATGYTAGVYCPDCEKWLEGHEEIAITHTDVNSDKYCDICGGYAVAVVETGKCGEEVIYNLYEDGMLIIGGHGEMYDYVSSPFREKEVSSLIVEEGVTSVGDNAFDNCKGLKNVELSDSVKRIGQEAFFSADSVAEINIGKNVSEIGEAAFCFLQSLEKVSIATENEYFSCDEYGALHDKEKAVLIVYPAKSTYSSYIMPDTVKTVSTFAFLSAKNIKSVKLSDNLSVIEAGAFYECGNLENVTFGNSLTKIERDAFTACVSLKEIILPDSVTDIEYQGFVGCTAVEKLHIGKNLKNIHYTSFGLLDSLKNITVDSENKYFSLDGNGVLFNKNKTELILYPLGSERNSYTVPEGVATIKSVAFYGCKNLNSITLPDSIDSIEKIAFEECVGLKNVNYGGTESQWKQIDVSERNEWLTNATIRYNYAYPCTNHTIVTLKAVAPTCTKEGKTEGKKCSKCGKITLAQKAVAKKAHNLKTVTTKATLSKNGKTENRCTVCGYVKTKTTVYYPKSLKLSATSYTYNGKIKTPSVTVKDSKGKTLKKNTDYTVSYSKGRKSVGKYTVTVNFKGKYSGTKKLTFTILPAKVTLSKVTAGSKSLTAQWKMVSGISGYEVQYSTSKKFTKKTTKTATIKNTKTKKTTVKKLSKGKKYYIRVRAYKTVSGKKLYGAWSTVKNVKVK